MTRLPSKKNTKKKPKKKQTSPREEAEGGVTLSIWVFGSNLQPITRRYFEPPGLFHYPKEKWSEQCDRSPEPLIVVALRVRQSIMSAMMTLAASARAPVAGASPVTRIRKPWRRVVSSSFAVHFGLLDASFSPPPPHCTLQRGFVFFCQKPFTPPLSFLPCISLFSPPCSQAQPSRQVHQGCQVCGCVLRHPLR